MRSNEIGYWKDKSGKQNKPNNSHSSVIWSAVPSAPQVFQNCIIDCYVIVAPKGPMTIGTTQGDSVSWEASLRVWKPVRGPGRPA